MNELEPKLYPKNKKYLVYPDGRIYNTKSKFFLSQEISHKGYARVSLDRKHYSVHRLVAETFIPNPSDLPQVNHIDENKLNNKVDNLEWCTPKYNQNYGTRNQRASISAKKTYEKIWRNNKNKPNVKPVFMCDLKTHEHLKEFVSAVEAAEYLGKQNKNAHINITNCLRGRTKSAYGYRWEYSNSKVNYPTLKDIEK
jgi:hypothetical protein